MAKKKSKKKNIWLIPSAIAFGSVVVLMGLAFLYVLLVGGFKTRYEALKSFAFKTNVEQGENSYIRLGEDFATDKYYIFYKQEENDENFTVLTCYNTKVMGTLSGEEDKSLYFKDVISFLHDSFEGAGRNLDEEINNNKVLIYRVYNISILPEPYDATELDFDLSITSNSQYNENSATFGLYNVKLDEYNKPIYDRKGYPVYEDAPYGISNEKRVCAKKPVEVLIKQNLIDETDKLNENDNPTKDYFISRIYSVLNEKVLLSIKNNSWTEVASEEAEETTAPKFDFGEFDTIIKNDTHEKYQNLKNYKVLADTFGRLLDTQRADYIYKAAVEIYDLMFVEEGSEETAIGNSDDNLSILEKFIKLVNNNSEFTLKAVTSDSENGAKVRLEPVEVNCFIDSEILRAELLDDLNEHSKLYINSSFKVNLQDYIPANSNKPYGNKAKDIKYFSDNEEVATVSSNGTVTVKQQSKFTIYAYVASLFEYENLLNNTEISAFGDLMHNLQNKIVWASKTYEVEPVSVQSITHQGSINVGIDNTFTFTLEEDNKDNISLRIYPDSSANTGYTPSYTYPGMLQKLEKVELKAKIKDNINNQKIDCDKEYIIISKELVKGELYNGVNVTIKALNEFDLTNKQLVIECCLTDDGKTYYADIPVVIESKVLYTLSNSLGKVTFTDIVYEKGKDNLLWKAYYNGEKVVAEAGTNIQDLLQKFVNLADKANNENLIKFNEASNYKHLKFFVEKGQTTFLTTQITYNIFGGYYEEIAGLKLISTGLSEYIVGLEEGVLYPINATNGSEAVTIYPMVVKTEIVNGVETPVYIDCNDARIYFFNGKYYTSYEGGINADENYEYLYDIYNGDVYKYESAAGTLYKDDSGKKLTLINGSLHYLYEGEVYTDGKNFFADNGLELFVREEGGQTYLYVNQKLYSSASQKLEEDVNEVENNFKVNGKRLYKLSVDGRDVYTYKLNSTSDIDNNDIYENFYTKNGNEVLYAWANSDKSKYYYEMYEVAEKGVGGEYDVNYEDIIYYLQGGKYYYYNDSTKNITDIPNSSLIAINLTAESGGYFKINVLEEAGGVKKATAQRQEILDTDVIVLTSTDPDITTDDVYAKVETLTSGNYLVDDLNNIYEDKSGTYEVTANGLYYYNGDSLEPYSKTDCSKLFVRKIVEGGNKILSKIPAVGADYNKTYFTETGDRISYNSSDDYIYVERVEGSIYSTSIYYSEIYQEYEGEVYKDINKEVYYDNSGDVVYFNEANQKYVYYEGLYAIKGEVQFVKDETNTYNKNITYYLDNSENNPTNHLVKILKDGYYKFTYNETEDEVVATRIHSGYKPEGDEFVYKVAEENNKYYAVEVVDSKVVGISSGYYIKNGEYLYNVKNNDNYITKLDALGNQVTQIKYDELTKLYYYSENYSGEIFTNVQDIKEVYLYQEGNYTLVKNEEYNYEFKDNYYGIDEIRALEVKTAGVYHVEEGEKGYELKTVDSTTTIYSDKECTKSVDVTLPENLNEISEYYINLAGEGEPAQAKSVYYRTPGYYSIYNLRPTLDYLIAVTTETDGENTIYKYNKLHDLTAGKYNFDGYNFIANENGVLNVEAGKEGYYYYYNDNLIKLGTKSEEVYVRNYTTSFFMVEEDGWYVATTAETGPWEIIKTTENAEHENPKKYLQRGGLYFSSRYAPTGIITIHEYSQTTKVVTYNDNTGLNLYYDEANEKYVNISANQLINSTTVGEGAEAITTYSTGGIAYNLNAKIYYESATEKSVEYVSDYNKNSNTLTFDGTNFELNGKNYTGKVKTIIVSEFYDVNYDNLMANKKLYLNNGLFYTDELFHNPYYGKVYMNAFKVTDSYYHFLTFSDIKTAADIDELKDNYIIEFYKAEAKDVVYKHNNWCYSTKNYYVKEVVHHNNGDTANFIFTVLNKIDESKINKYYSFTTNNEDYTLLFDKNVTIPNVFVDSNIYFKLSNSDANGNIVINDYTLNELINNNLLMVKVEDSLGNSVNNLEYTLTISNDGYISVKFTHESTYVVKILISSDLTNTNTDLFISILNATIHVKSGELSEITSATTQVKNIGVYSASSDKVVYYQKDEDEHYILNNTNNDLVQNELTINLVTNPEGFLCGKPVTITTNNPDVFEICNSSGNKQEVFYVDTYGCVAINYKILKLTNSDEEIELTISYKQNNITRSKTLEITLDKFETTLYKEYTDEKNNKPAIVENAIANGFAYNFNISSGEKEILLTAKNTDINLNYINLTVDSVEIYSIKTNSYLRSIDKDTNGFNIAPVLDSTNVKNFKLTHAIDEKDLFFNTEFMIVKVKVLTEFGYEHEELLEIKITNDVQAHFYLNSETYYGVQEGNLIKLDFTKEKLISYEKKGTTNPESATVIFDANYNRVDSFTDNGLYYYTTTPIPINIKTLFKEENGLLYEVNDFTTPAIYYYSTTVFNIIRYNEASFGIVGSSETFNIDRLFIKQADVLVEAGEQTIKYLAGNNLGFKKDVGGVSVTLKNIGYGNLNTYTLVAGKELGFVQATYLKPGAPPEVTGTSLEMENGYLLVKDGSTILCKIELTTQTYNAVDLNQKYDELYETTFDGSNLKREILLENTILNLEKYVSVTPLGEFINADGITATYEFYFNTSLPEQFEIRDNNTLYYCYTDTDSGNEVEILVAKIVKVGGLHYVACYDLSRTPLPQDYLTFVIDAKLTSLILKDTTQDPDKELLNQTGLNLVCNLKFAIVKQNSGYVGSFDNDVIALEYDETTKKFTKSGEAFTLANDVKVYKLNDGVYEEADKHNLVTGTYYIVNLFT